MLDGGTLMAQVRLFQALANETRVQLLRALLDGELNVTALVAAAGKEQSAISHHLACLRNCGLVKTRKDGKEIYYSLNGKGRIARLLTLADQHVEDTLEGVLSCEVLPGAAPKKVPA